MNTMYEKCAVAGDITQAIDRRGCWSVAICVIGGTEGTAVKLQSSETAGGVFTDYKTLIPSASAEADQYKGFVIDLYGAGKFIKVTGAKMAVAVLGDCDHDVKPLPITKGEVPTEATLETNKTATINVSEYTEPVEIEPSDDYDGMKKATVTLSNIPVGEATAYCWVFNEDNRFYFNVAQSPSDEEGSANLLGFGFGSDPEVHSFAESTYTRISDTSFSLVMDDVTVVFTRDATGDFTLWEVSE